MAAGHVRFALAHARHHERDIVLVQVAVFAQEFAVREESAVRGDFFERIDFVRRLAGRPERLARRAREDVDDLGVEPVDAAALVHDAVHDGIGLAVRKADHRPDFDIRRHHDGTVKAAFSRRTDNRCPVMLVEHRELERVHEEVFVVRDIQVLVVDLVRRPAVEFVHDAPRSAGHAERTAQGLPAANLDGGQVEIHATVERNKDARTAETTLRGKHHGIRTHEVGRADDAAEHLDIGIQVLEGIAETRSGGTRDCIVNLYALDPGPLGSLFEHALRDIVDIHLFHVVLGQIEFRRAVLEKRRRNNDFTAQLAIDNIATGGIAHPRHIREDVLNHIGKGLEAHLVENGRVYLEKHPVDVVQFATILQGNQVVPQPLGVTYIKRPSDHTHPNYS